MRIKSIEEFEQELELVQINRKFTLKYDSRLQSQMFNDQIRQLFEDWLAERKRILEEIKRIPKTIGANGVTCIPLEPLIRLVSNGELFVPPVDLPGQSQESLQDVGGPSS